MNEQRISEVLQGIAEEAVPDDLDLWPNVRAQVMESRAARRNGHIAARRPSHSIRNSVWAASVAIVVLAGLAFTPGVRTTVVEILGLAPTAAHDSTPTTSLTVTASATVPDTAFTGTPPSSTLRPTPTPLSPIGVDTGGQPLSFEDTPYPDEAN